MGMSECIREKKGGGRTKIFGEIANPEQNQNRGKKAYSANSACQSGKRAATRASSSSGGAMRL